MILQSSPFIVPLTFSAVLCGVLGVYSYQNLHILGSRAFTFLMGSVTIWLVGSIFEYSLIDPSTRYFAVIFEYLGIILVPVAWLIFILTYTGKDSLFQRRKIWLLFIIPALIECLVITNPVHHLFYTAITSDLVNGFIYPVYIPGPLFWIHAIYSYILILAGIGTIIAELIYAKPIYRKQLIIILFVCLIPFIFNFLFILKIWTIKGIDLTPLVFFITAGGLFISSYYFQFLNLTPVAHGLVIKNMKDALIVVDNKNNIVDANPSALTFHPLFTSYLGVNITDIFPFTSQVLTLSSPDQQIRGLPVELKVEGSMRFFEIQCIPVINNNRIQIGKLVTLHDVHERTVASRTVQKANQKLQLLSGITRHDIKNQLTILTGCLSLADEMDADEFRREYLGKMKDITNKINQQIEFTSLYQDIGMREPQWYDLFLLMKQVQTQITENTVTFINDMKGAKIYADPMLERALYNLFDNAIRYGNKITTIRSWYYNDENSMTWIVEDNGVGVATLEKDEIFRKGFGKNTGLGLFLVREILSITDCTIKENGIAGEGARFEIKVPKGLYSNEIEQNSLRRGKKHSDMH